MCPKRFAPTVIDPQQKGKISIEQTLTFPVQSDLFPVEKAHSCITYLKLDKNSKKSVSKNAFKVFMNQPSGNCQQAITSTSLLPQAQDPGVEATHSRSQTRQWQNRLCRFKSAMTSLPRAISDGVRTSSSLDISSTQVIISYFVIAPNGEILLAHLDANYRNRLEPSEALAIATHVNSKLAHPV